MYSFKRFQMLLALHMTRHFPCCSFTGRKSDLTHKDWALASYCFIPGVCLGTIIEWKCWYFGAQNCLIWAWPIHPNPTIPETGTLTWKYTTAAYHLRIWFHSHERHDPLQAALLGLCPRMWPQYNIIRGSNISLSWQLIIVVVWTIKTTIMYKVMN